RNEQTSSGEEHRRDERSETAAAVEFVRGAGFTSQTLHHRADRLPQSDEQRNNEGVVEMPEVVDRRQQQWLPYPHADADQQRDRKNRREGMAKNRGGRIEVVAGRGRRHRRGVAPPAVPTT